MEEFKTHCMFDACKPKGNASEQHNNTFITQSLSSNILIFPKASALTAAH